MGLVGRIALDGSVVATYPDLALPESFDWVSVIAGKGESISSISDTYYDQFHLYLSGVNILANGGFEDAEPGGFSSYPPPIVTGNWGRYRQAGTTDVSRSSTIVSSGTYSGRVNVAAPGSSVNGYFFQDVSHTFIDVDTLDLELDVMIWRVSGEQSIYLLFDWDRSLGLSAGTCRVNFTPTGTYVSMFGESDTLAAISTGSWHHLQIFLEFNLPPNLEAERWATGFSWSES